MPSTLTVADPSTNGGLTREVVELSTLTNLPMRVLGYKARRWSERLTSLTSSYARIRGCKKIRRRYMRIGRRLVRVTLRDEGAYRALLVGVEAARFGVARTVETVVEAIHVLDARGCVAIHIDVRVCNVTDGYLITFCVEISEERSAFERRGTDERALRVAAFVHIQRTAHVDRDQIPLRVEEEPSERPVFRARRDFARALQPFQYTITKPLVVYVPADIQQSPLLLIATPPP